MAVHILEAFVESSHAFFDNCRGFCMSMGWPHDDHEGEIRLLYCVQVEAGVMISLLQITLSPT